MEEALVFQFAQIAAGLKQIENKGAVEPLVKRWILTVDPHDGNMREVRIDSDPTGDVAAGAKSDPIGDVVVRSDKDECRQIAEMMIALGVEELTTRIRASSVIRAALVSLILQVPEYTAVTVLKSRHDTSKGAKLVKIDGEWVNVADKATAPDPGSKAKELLQRLRERGIPAMAQQQPDPLANVEFHRQSRAAWDAEAQIDDHDDVSL